MGHHNRKTVLPGRIISPLTKLSVTSKKTSQEILITFKRLLPYIPLREKCPCSNLTKKHPLEPTGTITAFLAI